MSGLLSTLLLGRLAPAVGEAGAAARGVGELLGMARYAPGALAGPAEAALGAAGKAGAWAARNPWASLDIAGTGAFLGDEVLAPILEKSATDSTRTEINAVTREREVGLLRMLRMKRLQEAKQENLRRLMVLRPDIFNQVATGRRLPQGAFVIGGQPDMEALNQLAMMMTQGKL